MRTSASVEPAELGDLHVAEAVVLREAQQRRIQRSERGDLGGDLVDEHDLVDEPRVDPGRLEDLIDGRARAQRLLHGDDAAVGRDGGQRRAAHPCRPARPRQWKLLPRFSSERSAFCRAVE